MPAQAPDEVFHAAFLTTTALDRGWWRDIEIVGEAGDWLLTGGLWGGSDDDFDLWSDFVGVEDDEAFAFEISADDIQRALEFIAALPESGPLAQQAFLSRETVFEARKWVAGEWADHSIGRCEADAVLQIAVQLVNGAKRPVMLFSQSN